MRTKVLAMALMTICVVATIACSSDETSSTSVSDVVDSAQAIDSIGDVVEGPEASSAASLALADDRLADLLRGNDHAVESVRTGNQSGGGLVVSVRFEVPLDDGAVYPLDTCSIDTGGAPITGVRWLVQGDSIAAVSPIWGTDIACGY